jgi:hypothetical protein
MLLVGASQTVEPVRGSRSSRVCFLNRGVGYRCALKAADKRDNVVCVK